MHQSTKTFGHEVGLSCAFRQHKAQSHCRLIHGYALAFKFTFETEELDETNWVVDFGGLKSLKGLLEDTFDHTLLVAADDPKKDVILDLDRVHGIAKVVEVEAAGCERTAQLVYEVTEQWLKDAGFAPRCRLVSVEVSEHGANSAIYRKSLGLSQLDGISIPLKMWMDAAGAKAGVVIDDVRAAIHEATKK